MKSTLFLLLITLSQTLAQFDFDKSERSVMDLTAIAGWGSPYGMGIEPSFYFNNNLNLGAGIGFSLSGGKFGTGVKYYLLPDKMIDPFLGANVTYSTGLSKITVRVENDSAVYKIDKGSFVTLRGGGQD